MSSVVPMAKVTRSTQISVKPSSRGVDSENEITGRSSKEIMSKYAEYKRYGSRSGKTDREWARHKKAFDKYAQKVKE